VNATRVACAFVVSAFALTQASAQSPRQASDPTPRLTVVLAADPSGDGPPALVWLRRAGLPAFASAIGALDRDAQWTLRLTVDGVLTVVPSAVELDAGCYARIVVTVGGRTIEGRCDTNGIEDWVVERPLPAMPGRFATLLALLRVDDAPLPRQFDVGAVVGNLMPALPDEDPMRALLFDGAVECGDVTFAVAREATRVRVRGRSAGGLTLPVVLTLLAELRSRPDPALRSRDVADGESHALVARAGRDEHRDESIRQLARSEGAEERRVLYGLLHADDEVRVAAMEALVRAGDVDAVPRLLAAATRAIPESERMAELALATLLEAPRERTKPAPRSAGLPSAESDVAVPPPPGSEVPRVVALIASILLSLVLVAALRRRAAADAADFVDP
jgi:hypothetical protein